MERTTVSGTGRVQIPARLRERLGLKIGASIAWSEQGGVLVGVPMPENPVEELYGAWLRCGEPSALEGLAALRAEERGVTTEAMASP